VQETKYVRIREVRDKVKPLSPWQSHVSHTVKHALGHTCIAGISVLNYGERLGNGMSDCDRMGNG
jgi:hypothetical protein